MATVTYDRQLDPYNDFISEGGKIWPRVKWAIAECLAILLRKL
jgi:hypothetical protein